MDGAALKIQIGPDNLLEITWSAVLTIMTLALGFGIWMATIEVQSRAQAADIADIQVMETENVRHNKEVESRLSRMEATMELILKIISKENK